MEVSERLETLKQMFKDREWVFDVGLDQYGRLVVYTKFTCHETLHDIPDRVDGQQVMVHFADSKTATREKFTNSPNAPGSLLKPFVAAAKAAQVKGVDTGFGQAADDIEELPSNLLEFDTDDLCKELDRLEKICGTNILQDIFYELHDGKNAVTNLSVRYPEVRARLEKLYDEFGFDVIYEEMDG